MIQLVERQLGGAYMDDSYWPMYEMTEDGDVLIISPSIPPLGLTHWNSVPVIREEHNGSGSFELYMKYSLDEGLTWSEWNEVSLQFVSSIPFKANHVPVIEFQVIKRGEGNSYFIGLDVFSDENIDCEEPAIPDFYNKFNDRVSYYNFDSIRWALNVLKKVYEEGTLPKFIERGENQNWNDEDFINFWWSVIYPTALRISIAKEFTDLLWNPDMLKNYLNQRGLITGKTTNLIELFYLMTHFYEEEARRGSLSVLDYARTTQLGGIIRGPIARLIDAQDENDLSLKYINSWELGWWLGQTSPCGYQTTDNFMNYGVGYENEPFKSVDNYPVTNPYGTSIYIMNFEISSGVIKKALDIFAPTGVARTYSGIGKMSSAASLDLTKPKIPISVNKDYVIEISFAMLGGNTAVDDLLVYFGVHGYDEEGNHLNAWTQGWDSQDTFFNDDGNGLVGFFKYTGSFTSQRRIYKLYGVIRNYYYGEDPYCYDGFSMSKVMDSLSLAYIEPYFGCKHNTTNVTGGEIYVTDFRVYELDNADMYLGIRTNKVSKMKLKNRNFALTNSEIEKIIKTELFPFEEANCEIKFE